MNGDRNCDQCLIHLAQQGESAAFGILVTKYKGRLMRLVSRVVSNPADAEDVVQETFIRAYRGLNSFRGESMFYTWLYRIAINVAKTQWNLNSRRELQFSQIGIEGEFDDVCLKTLTDASTPESILAGKQLAKAITAALKALPIEFRTSLILREHDGFSYEEIAEIMNCPLGTVRSRIFRAREVIAAHLARC